MALRWKHGFLVKFRKHNSCGYEEFLGEFLGLSWMKVTGVVLGARNCVNLHLLIDIIHDCCNHTRPLVHLKQFNTHTHKHKSNLLLQYSFEANKNFQNRACYPFHQVHVPSQKTTISDVC